MLIAIGTIVGALLVLIAALLMTSAGVSPTFRDASGQVVANSISEKLRVEINGAEQGMFIVGKDRTRPVLLFLHGGPGMPEFALSRNYPSVLEDLFVVCWWDFRGSGLSYRSDASVTLEQLVLDTIAVTTYLRQRFGQDKVYLMGHSGGSLVGIQAAARAPELYHSYIGVAQITQQMDSEKLAYRFMREQFAALGDRKMVDALDRIPLPQLQTMPAEYRALRDGAMHALGVGTTHTMRSVVTGIFLPIMLSPVYTLREKIDLWRGKWSAQSTNMWNELLATDLPAIVPRISVPVYFLHGKYDYTVSYDMARDYLDRLEAPLKGFYTFDESAHSPLFEEPERMRQILEDDVLAGSVSRADRP